MLTPAYAGVWQGELKYTSCLGGRHCFAVTGSARPFVLRLHQIDRAVSGYFEVPQLSLVVEVGGEVQDQGQLVIRGAAAGGEAQSPVDLRRLEVRADGSSGLAGSLEYVLGSTYYRGELLSGVVTLAADIVSASRVASDDRLTSVTSFDGMWRGRFVVRACTFVGLADCYPHAQNDVLPIELRLTQTGATVAGELLLVSRRISVTGQSEGARWRSWDR